MKDIKSFNFEEKKLFAFYLGGKIENCKIEMHDVVFILGNSGEDIINQVRKKWIGTSKFHIDSYLVLENIGGYKISISKNKPKTDEKLFFVNIGSYVKDKFGESHFFGFYIAKSRREAIKKATNDVSKDQKFIHMDNIYDLDDCIMLDKIDENYINCILDNSKKESVSRNGYIELTKLY